MKKILLFLVALIGTIGISTMVSADVPSTIDFNKIHKVWSDEFDGNELNSDYWECQVGNGSQYGVYEWGNNE